MRIVTAEHADGGAAGLPVCVLRVRPAGVRLGRAARSQELPVRWLLAQ